MKLLIICPSLSDKALAASFRLIYLTKSFLEHKFSITAYLSDPEISVILKDYLLTKQLEIRIINISFQKNILNRIVSRVIGIPDSLVFWGYKVERAVLKNKNQYDAIFTSSPPHSLQVVGKEIALKMNIPHFTDFRDDWMGSHRLRHLTILHRLLSKRHEKLVLKNAKIVTHAIPLVANEWKEKFPNEKNKIKVLTNGFPNSLLNYKVNINTKTYNKNVIAYFGGSYNNFVVNQFVQLRNQLIALGLSDRWMIVTGGPFEIPFTNDEVWKHYGNIPQTDIYDYLYNVTIHISLLPPGDLNPSRTIPLKLFTQITTTGTCVFIGNNGATTELFKDIEGLYFLGKNGWNLLGKWILENENYLLKKNYKRNNIQRFNFEDISNNLCKIIIENNDSCKLNIEHK